MCVILNRSSIPGCDFLSSTGSVLDYKSNTLHIHKQKDTVWHFHFFFIRVRRASLCRLVLLTLYHFSSSHNYRLGNAHVAQVTEMNFQQARLESILSVAATCAGCMKELAPSWYMLTSGLCTLVSVRLTWLKKDSVREGKLEEGTAVEWHAWMTLLFWCLDIQTKSHFFRRHSLHFRAPASGSIRLCY